MISVEVHYKHIRRKSNNDMYVYTDVYVNGHANYTGEKSMKCCASITAILMGVAQLSNQYNEHCEISSGHFEYHLNPSTIKKKGKRYITTFDLDTQYGLNCVMYQLKVVSDVYPEFFKKFEFIDESEEIENYDERKNYEWHKPKQKRMGLHSSEEIESVEDTK